MEVNILAFIATALFILVRFISKASFQETARVLAKSNFFIF